MLFLTYHFKVVLKKISAKTPSEALAATDEDSPP
jgi:hypothetical protein